MRRRRNDAIPFRVWFEANREICAECEECEGLGEYIENGREHRCRAAYKEYRLQVERDRERWRQHEAETSTWRPDGEIEEPGVR